MTDRLFTPRHSAANAPKCGREFLGLLSNDKKVVMRAPKSSSEYYQYWDVDGGDIVPMPETICPEQREEFIELVEWYELPLSGPGNTGGENTGGVVGGGHSCLRGDM